MKIVRQANGKTSVKLSKAEWQSIGKTAGWEEDWGEERIDEDEIDLGPEVDPALMKEIQKIEQEVDAELGNDKVPIPEELKQEKRQMLKKDESDWAADRLERAKQKERANAINQQQKKEKWLEKAVYSKPPVQ